MSCPEVELRLAVTAVLAGLIFDRLIVRTCVIACGSPVFCENIVRTGAKFKTAGDLEADSFVLCNFNTADLTLPERFRIARRIVNVDSDPSVPVGHLEIVIVLRCDQIFLCIGIVIRVEAPAVGGELLIADRQLHHYAVQLEGIIIQRIG